MEISQRKKLDICKQKNPFSNLCLLQIYHLPQAFASAKGRMAVIKSICFTLYYVLFESQKYVNSKIHCQFFTTFIFIVNIPSPAGVCKCGWLKMVPFYGTVYKSSLYDLIIPFHACESGAEWEKDVQNVFASGKTGKSE